MVLERFRLVFLWNGWEFAGCAVLWQPPSYARNKLPGLGSGFLRLETAGAQVSYCVTSVPALTIARRLTSGVSYAARGELSINPCGATRPSNVLVRPLAIKLQICGLSTKMEGRVALVMVPERFRLNFA